MRKLWNKALGGKALEFLDLLDAAIGFGLVSGAAVVAALGNLLLGAILAAFALGVFRRLTRRKTKAAASANDIRSEKPE